MTSQERKNKILSLHKANPNIYEAFRKMALDKFERINGHEFKVNNDFSSLCSRLFIKEYPRYEERFSFRTSVFDDKDLDKAQLDMFY